MKRIWRTSLIWSLVLGGIAFCCGYLLPLVFSPDANQGPLLGIFVTGPIAAAAGFFSGLIVGAAQLSPRAESRALVVAGLATLIASVDAALPQPEVLAMIVDGHVVDCRPIERASLEEATHQWREPPVGG
jgi:uncharacterized membrane protein YccC